MYLAQMTKLHLRVDMTLLAGFHTMLGLAAEAVELNYLPKILVWQMQGKQQVFQYVLQHQQL
jgi:hypothetical protein